MGSVVLFCPTDDHGASVVRLRLVDRHRLDLAAGRVDLGEQINESDKKRRADRKQHHGRE